MALINSWIYTKSIFESEKFLKATHNEFQFVAQKPYISKKNPSDKGVTVTLLIIHDDEDYGVDKKTGNKRDSNVLNTFDVTILNGRNSLPFKKGDKVALVNYIEEKSFVIGFDIMLRFADLRKVSG